MTKKKDKEFRNFRDYYIIKFNDGDPEKWRIGNLHKFLRHLYSDNKRLRELNPNIKSPQKFAVTMGNRICGNLRYAFKITGDNVAEFCLVDISCDRETKKFFGGHITRVYTNRFKGIQPGK